MNVTGYELAYARAPPNMKSLVMAMFLVTNAIFITLASWIIPLVKDPNLIVSLYSMRAIRIKLMRCPVDLG